MMLLTSCGINLDRKESIWKVVEYYLARWKCEESYRYLKHCYNVEDVRVRSYRSLRNIMVLVLAVSYFLAVYLGEQIRSCFWMEKILIMSNRFFGVPSFFNYAIADGIYNLLASDKTGINFIKNKSLNNTNTFQLCFNFDD